MEILPEYKNIFFIGVAGSGMSGIAQYLRMAGKNVSGSDRYFSGGEALDIKGKLESEGIKCFLQDGSGIDDNIDLVCASTAVEETVLEMVKARELNIPVLRRSELLSKIVDSTKTIAVGGTSGKSTTSAMIYHIMKQAGYSPGIISGAGLTSIIKQGKLGNADFGNGKWLIIEADESDGSIVQYKPSYGLLLNIDKDHQEMDELMKIFSEFRDNTREVFISNQSNRPAARLSVNIKKDFSVKGEAAGFVAENFNQDGFKLTFTINNVPFEMNSLGHHNMENATAAVAVCSQGGISISESAEALKTYEGIYRRNQILGEKNGVWVIDDYAHNPVKCAAAIRSCQQISSRVIAWFQPHGYGPTRFLRHDFAEEISQALRPQDEIWMSEIFYAGGTATKNISAEDLINDIKAKGSKARFVADRNELTGHWKNYLQAGDVLLLMGARDPGLERFGKQVFENL